MEGLGRIHHGHILCWDVEHILLGSLQSVICNIELIN